VVRISSFKLNKFMVSTSNSTHNIMQCLYKHKHKHKHRYDYEIILSKYYAMIVLYFMLIRVACDNLIISPKNMKWGHVSFSSRTRRGGHKKVDTTVFMIIHSFFDPTIEKGERENRAINY